MASDSGTELLRCMQPSAAEQRSRGAAVEPGPKLKKKTRGSRNCHSHMANKKADKIRPSKKNY